MRQTAFSRIRCRASALWGLKWLTMTASVEDMRDCDEGFLVGDGGMLEVPGDTEADSGLLHTSRSRSFAAVGWSRAVSLGIGSYGVRDGDRLRRHFP